MFEKESKEYANKWLEHVKDLELQHKSDDKPEYIRILEAHQRGAEFGYNLAKEEMDYLNKHWRSEEERKANEWHYCKDEFPDHNGQFYVALKGHTETFICTYDYDEEDDSNMIWFDDDYNVCDEVYAWREKLEAPKEIE